MALHRTSPPPKLGVPLTEEQKQAILAVAGRRKDGPSMNLWMEEIEKYREFLRQEEIAEIEELDQKRK